MSTAFLIQSQDGVAAVVLDDEELAKRVLGQQIADGFYKKAQPFGSYNRYAKAAGWEIVQLHVTQRQDT